MVDARVQKTFRVYHTLKIHVFADVFNLFNDDTFVRYRSNNIWSAAYGVPATIPYPRRVQIGVRIEF